MSFFSLRCSDKICRFSWSSFVFSSDQIVSVFFFFSSRRRHTRCSRDLEFRRVLFRSQGYHSTTMRDLAAATDMSLAGMYYYVRGKEELLFRIQERCFMRVLAGAEGALAGLGDADPGARLQAFIRHHVTFFTAHMAEMKVLSHEANSLTGERLRKVNAIKRRYVDLLEGLLKDVAPDESAVDR